MNSLHIAGALAAFALSLFGEDGEAKPQRVKRGGGADCQRGFCQEFDTDSGVATCTSENNCNAEGCLVMPRFMCFVSGLFGNPFQNDDSGTDRPAGADLLDPSAFLE